MMGQSGSAVTVPEAPRESLQLCCAHYRELMISVRDLARSLGGLLTEVLPQPQCSVDDITLVELDRGVVGVPGDLALGVGVDDPRVAVRLVVAMAGRGVGALVLRRPSADHPDVVAAATEHGIALLQLAEHASWAHIVWLLRGLLDRTLGQLGQQGHGGARPAAAEELFAIADAAAGLVGGPVTIEDAHSRVLAYSSRQESSDPARVSTIVGRRVPDPVIRHLRARGVFRRLIASPEPFFVAAQRDSPVGARFVIPVHAGGEWLGSIWALVPEPPDAASVGELERITAVVALQLLQLRSQADLSRRVAMDRLRTALTDGTADSETWLPAGPWRVVALIDLDPSAQALEVARRLDTWETVFRRHSWPQPRLVDIADQPYVLVRDDSTTDVPTLKSAPGGWTWLSRVLTEISSGAATLAAAAGGRVEAAADLPRSRTQAQEVAQAVASGAVPGPAVTIEEAWAPLSRSVVAEAMRAHQLPTPCDVLVSSDEKEGTAYASTLAAWLDHLGSPREAAALLGIHPNTLRHRLQRIGELLDADLDDASTRLALRLRLLALGH